MSYKAYMTLRLLVHTSSTGLSHFEALLEAYLLSPNLQPTTNTWSRVTLLGQSEENYVDN